MCKKRIDVIAGETAYLNLATFKDIEEMNRTIREYREKLQELVKRVDVQSRLITLLELLKRHSCKQIGVSYMSKNTIASYLNLSYKTVQRLMKKLEDLGMIKQVATKRKSDMRQTANATIIIPVEEVSDKIPTKKYEKCPTNKTKSISLKQENINIRNVGETEKNLKSVDNHVDNTIDFYDYTYVSSNVPYEFILTVKPFFNNAADIYKLWSRAKLAARKANIDIYNQLESFIKTFKETIFNIKQGRNRIDVYGYIYGAWRKIADVIGRRMNNTVWNWLED